MFPLGSVLFPHAVLPLQVFEHRYLTMVDEALRADGRFGVVLIERGAEVGGGDTRFDVGTFAKIVRAGRLTENRLMIVAVGTQRFSVVEWLEDGPYPRAVTEPIEEMEADTDVLAEALERTARTWRRVMAMAIELGAEIPSIDLELPDAQSAAVWTLSATAPIEQLDRQRLLEIDDPIERLDALEAALHGKLDEMEARLG